MKGITELEIELRGQLVTINCYVTNPDRDVGIMDYDFEDEQIIDAAGTVLDWELTDEEHIKVGDSVRKIVYSYDGSDDYEPSPSEGGK